MAADLYPDASGAASPAGSAEGARVAEPPQRDPLRWFVFAVVIAANIMDLLDGTIVNVAGPSIRAALGGSASSLQWLPAGYTLSLAVFLITSARLGDMFGRRRLFLIGSAGFTLFSTACALAPSMSVLIVFRVLQGAFGAMMIPQGFGMLKESFDDDEMSKVFGAFGPMMGLSMLGAPILAGGLVEANLWGVGWRLVFLINVPIGLATFIGGSKVLPRTITHPGVRLDIIGTALVGLALTALIYPLIQGRTDGWPTWTFVMFTAGVVLLVAFVLWERHRRVDPLIERSLLSNRSYTSGVLVALTFFGAFSGLLLCVSICVQVGEGFSPVRAGVTLLPMVIGMVAGMAGGFALVKPLGRRLLHLGVMVVAAGTVTLAVTMTHLHHASILDLVPSLVLIGVGFGGSLGQLFDFIVAGVGTEEVGSASGVLEAVQQISTAAGVAAFGTVFFSAYTRHLPTHALAVTAWACLAPTAATFALVFMLPMRAREAESAL